MGITLSNRNLMRLSALLGFIFICVYTVFFNKHGFCYDEPWYLENVSLLKEAGFSSDFLLRLKGPAGPLYALVHWTLFPLTNLEVVPTRMVNIVFSLCIVLFIYLLIGALNPEKKSTSYLFFAIPMAYPTIGLALTEIPAMFFLTASLLLLVYGLHDRSWRRYLLMVASGFLFSLAVIGRQPYLLVLVSVVLFFLVYERNHLTEMFIVSFFSVLIPAFVFFTWKGLVPKIGDVATQKAAEINYLFFALGYGFITLFTDYRLIIIPKSRFFIIYIMALAGLVLVCYFAGISFTPLSTIMKTLLPAFLFTFYGFFMAGLLMFSGLYFLYSYFWRIYERREEKYFVFFSMALLLVVISSVKVTHQFSSRYVFQAAPFFVLLSSFNKGQQDRVQVLFSVVGTILGIGSLLSYCQ
jgi:hypothetical protein